MPCNTRVKDPQLLGLVRENVVWKEKLDKRLMEDSPDKGRRESEHIFLPQPSVSSQCPSFLPVSSPCSTHG